jgi:hypothetical protein
MARGAQTEATGTETEAVTSDKPKRRVVNRGARGAQPIYVFVKTNADNGKLEISKSMRDPRKMAAYLQEAMAAGETFLVTTPE